MAAGGGTSSLPFAACATSAVPCGWGEHAACCPLLLLPFPAALQMADMLAALLQEYIALDMPAALQEAGFGQPLQASNTPRHKTVVAVKQ